MFLKIILKKENVIFILGNIERIILENIEDIVNKLLLIDKVISYYKEVKGVFRDVVFGYVIFINEVKNVSIDWNNFYVRLVYLSLYVLFYDN